MLEFVKTSFDCSTPNLKRENSFYTVFINVYKQNWKLLQGDKVPVEVYEVQLSSWSTFVLSKTSKANCYTLHQHLKANEGEWNKLYNANEIATNCPGSRKRIWPDEALQVPTWYTNKTPAKALLKPKRALGKNLLY